jgi:hypothetical protein
MEKFKKVIELKGSILGHNKYDGFIYGELESRSSGDWNVYEDGEVVEYGFELLEKSCDDDDLNYIDDLNLGLEDEDKILLNDLKEYVGEGICYDGNYNDNDWYNVKFVGDVMVISFICIEGY